jgi:cbb3-type cytochrome oxidase maturation protein
MDHQMDTFGYLIPISLVLGFIVFPTLWWLGVNSEKNQDKKED